MVGRPRLQTIPRRFNELRDAPALAINAPSARSGPVRKRPVPQTPRGKGPPSLLRRVFARPGVTIAGAAFAAVMTSIVANALLFQKGRHPSPLFQQQQDADAVPPKPAPLPPPRPAAAEQAAVTPPPVVASEPVAPPTTASAQVTPKPMAAPVAKSRVKAKPRVDGIARLLGQAPTTRGASDPAQPKTAPTAKHKPALAVASGTPHT